MVEKSIKYLKNYFSKGSKVTLFIVMAILVLSISVFAFVKSITVAVDGKEYKVITFKSTYRAALMSSNIIVGPKDKATPSLDSKVVNGSVINIRRSMNVKVKVDGKVLDINSAEDNVEKMLEAEGIGLKDLDKVYPAKDSILKNGIMVEVVRVEYKDIKETNAIDFSTVVKNDNSMQHGVTKVLQSGQQGQKESVVRLILENGKEISRQLISETVKTQPVQKIVAVGTVSTVSYSRGGDFSAAKSLRMKATAYTASEGSSTTASGTYVRRSASGYSTIAVDPRVIPLGTKLYVEGYGYAIAEDTGGAIKGNIIDLYFSSSSECNNWGVRYVNVYVIK